MSCKFGVERQDCLKANGRLIKLGEQSLHCQSCDIDRISAAVAEILSSGDEVKIKRARAWFKRMGFGATLDRKRPALNTGFICPIIKETIHTTCSMEKCAWYIEYPWSGNCVLAYMHQQESDVLSPEEISYLYQLPIEQIRSLIDNATSLLRSTAIDTHAQETNNAREFVYFITNKVCCVCESTVDEFVPRSLQIEKVGAVYCSKECKEKKHPKIVELEIAKGISIEKILDWSFHHYKSLSVAENALGLPRWLIYESCRRYLGKPIESFFPALSAAHKQRATTLIRRTWHAPSWVNTMIDSQRTIRRQLWLKYGPPGIKPSGITRALDDLIQNL